MGATACGPSLSAEPRWVQWLAYREVVDLAVSPEGRAVVVGHSTSDENATDATYGQYTERPFVALVDADGTLVEHWTGFLGSARAAAMDDEGRAYVALRGLRDDQDWGAPAHCELRALDVEGQVRWSQRWPDPECPADVAIAGDAVVVLVGDGMSSRRIEAFELDGSPRWQQPAEGFEALATAGEAIWVATNVPGLDPGDPSEAMAWRHDARDGRATEVRLSLGTERSLLAYEATPDGLLVTARSSDGTVLVSLTPEGRRRWAAALVAPTGDAEGSSAWTVSPGRMAEGRDAWVVGSEQTSGASEPPSVRRRMRLQRWSSDGTDEGTLRFAFEDPGAAAPDQADPAILARAECPTTDVIEPLRFGSHAHRAVARPDGSLLVAGQQGCRDAFLLHLEVER